MEPFKFNSVYHSHTERCGHAHGKDEEFVLKAISRGIKTLCFTDHCPIPFFSQKGIRMDIDELPGYVSSINSLKEKYKDQIDIHIGLECENFPTNNGYLHDFLEKDGIEFLIVSEHVVMIDNKITWLVNKEYSRTQILNEYADSIVNALDTGLSKYVGHPDLIIWCLNSNDEEIEKAMRKIVEAAIRNDAYLEFNVHGIINCKLSEFGYPNMWFWKMIKNEYPEAKITLGLDIHNIIEYDSSEWLDEAIDIAKDLGLNVVENIDVKKELCTR